jgi:hypothetical protein
VKAARTGSLCVALALLGACTTLPLPDPKFEGPYGKALARATRKATLYNGLETRAFVRATYLSPEFIAAQAAELSRLRAEPPAEAAQRLARMLDENKMPSFFVAVHTPFKDWNDWQEPTSVWRLAVDAGHGQIDKPKVTRVDRPDAEILSLYPYLDVYSVGYVLHFTGDPQPAPAQTLAGGVMASALGQVQLLAAGALGVIKLEWALPAQAEASR